MRKLIIIFNFVSFSLVTTAQHTGPAAKVDSLLKLLVTSREDTGKAMIFLTLASIFETNNQD